MLARLRTHTRRNIVSYLALFVALGGTSAYAINTIGSSDVINNSLLSEDVKQGTLVRGDLAPSTLTGSTVLDESLSFFDLAPGTIVNSRIADNAVSSGKVANNSLTGDDVDESALGTRVVQRVRQTSGTTSSGSAGTEVTVPRSGGSWTQAADEVDHLIVRATITAPAATCAPSALPGNELKLKVGSETLLAKEFFSSAGTQTLSLDVPGLPSPGAPTVRTFNATVMDKCTTADNLSISNLKVNVVGIK